MHRPLLLCALALPAAYGCGSAAGGTDAGATQNDVLSVLDPPGDSIGLDFSGTATLRVQLATPEGAPVANVPVTFTIVETGSESAGGSGLSSTEERTNTIGIASVDLVAGAERVNFRVEASAAGATSAIFFIQVSDQGFSNARIRTAHEGPRDAGSYDIVELRIYDDRDWLCETIDLGEPAESLYPPHTQPTLGSESQFNNLAVGRGYTVIAWAQAGESSTVQATGCLHLPANRLQSGSDIEALLPVSDLSYALPDLLLVETTVDLAPLAETLSGASLWNTLACPFGRAHLLLDCLPDAQSDDGSFDCIAEAPSVLRDTLAGRRGLLDAEGCRTAQTEGGQASIDAELDEALGGWPSDEELTALLDGRNASLGTLELTSELSQAVQLVAEHSLVSCELGGLETNLVESTRPILTAPSVPVELGADPRLRLDSHGFTLRYGELASGAFEVLGLSPANISGQADRIGTEFLSTLSIDALSGCPALEAFVCSEVGAAPECADACSAIAPALDVLLHGWLDDLDVSGLDVRIEVDAETADANRDLVVERFEGDAEVVIETSNGPVPISAQVTGALP